MAETIDIQSRRYIGCKAKLLPWIFNTIQNETTNIKSFCDIFAGTGVVANEAIKKYETVLVNDILFSNQVIYKAFWDNGKVSKRKIQKLIAEFNSIDAKCLDDNYFSLNYGNKFFDIATARKIGFIRDYIEKETNNITLKEKNILLASLIYGMDKIANTIGHYEAYIRKEIKPRDLKIKMIDFQRLKNVIIHQEDSNKLARKISCDLVYIDPPYNSRQYSRFYHLYETLVKWDKPKLSGTAMKPPLENMSEYCSSRAKNTITDLVQNLDTRYLVVSYNNTYNSKSSSSQNKIQLNELNTILSSVGKTKIFEHSHHFFNAGKTEFINHKELLFVTKVK